MRETPLAESVLRPLLLPRASGSSESGVAQGAMRWSRISMGADMALMIVNCRAQRVSAPRGTGWSEHVRSRPFSRGNISSVAYRTGRTSVARFSFRVDPGVSAGVHALAMADDEKRIATLPLLDDRESDARGQRERSPRDLFVSGTCVDRAATPAVLAVGAPRRPRLRRVLPIARAVIRRLTARPTVACGNICS